MSSFRPAVTPTTSSSYPSLPDDSGIFNTGTPPPPQHAPYTSPSPRTRRRSDSRDVGNPALLRSHFPNYDAIDNNPHRPRPQDNSHSTFPSNPPRSSSFAASNPPRTSSLLPPARILIDPASPQATDPLLRESFNDPRPPPPVPDSARDREGDPRQHKRGHSRSGSAGGLSDTLRNLNRWSASTTSSRASNLADFTRRSRTTGTELPAPTIPPLQSLPRISIGPSLAHQVLESNVLGRFSEAEQAGNGPQQSRETGGSWNGRSAREEQGEASQQQQQANFAEPPHLPAMITHESTMPYTQNGPTRGHSRSRSTGAKGSADTTVSTRSRDKDRDRDRERERQGKPPSQKAMLSKALQKANTAVQLDNAQNFEGARRAYAEACAVLQQVLLRTAGEEDRKKLEAISAFSRARYNDGSTLRPPTMDNAYMPPPLSPRRALSPSRRSSPPPVHESPQRPPPDVPISNGKLALPHKAPAGHKRVNSHESVSWLDPIDESERSDTASVHSRSSSKVRRKHIRAASGATEAEFDAALDDAIEAAYDDGYEPEPERGLEYLGHRYRNPTDDPVAKTLRRVEMARELVRESEREALELANEREKRLRLQQELEDEEYRRQEGLGEGFFDGDDSEDEERQLEAMTRGNAIEDFALGGLSRAPVPRESDSSGMTGRTWHSSMGSNPPTATTLLTPVSEDNVLPGPTGPLPALPPHATATTPLSPQPQSAGSQSSAQSVRNRRLSGQNPKELKIETTQLSPIAPATAGPSIPAHTKAGNYIVQQRQALSAGPNRTTGPFSARSGPSPVPKSLEEEPEDESVPPMPPQDDYPRVGTPSVIRPNLRKNYSSSSLKSLKTRTLSISHMEESSDHSPSTPFSNQFGARLPAVPSLPAGIANNSNNNKDRANSATAQQGLHLFDSHFHALPETPRSLNPTAADAPAPLEPCPSDVMLRPFWLMRALYQTLCHPRGGYLSSKVFVPRDVWRVKGVKLRGVEDKTHNCDLLTAALQKLARVDDSDADAVLDEMQQLEGVLEQVQATLARKLGSEVGVQGAGALFKDAGGFLGGGGGVGGGGGGGADAASADAAGGMPRSGSVAGKGSSFSWRRLRSKNSSANLPGLATAYGGKGGSGGAGAVGAGVAGGGGASSTNLSEGAAAAAGKDMVLPSLPMTSHPTSRPTKRDVGSVVFAGPNANYMHSLAKLFDAAQTVDQIARQVDDPGLRHADKTQVGLELCTRHAAEFFAFYICRFVLSDLTMLLDKFIKRGTEWVLT
ncbi:hypothetical protein N658DRAFT_553183 [Parathielavia hyrcaniae]|uniref:MIT domain-containing protein n=1 Tax=Parathielavia hyrcaniae TaxID=113614 RepID=A0AAN6SWQ3_9PEZI|nr:hypothetical protein N658DRAFT_553183 [Parathielavia hyrcaniae]